MAAINMRFIVISIEESNAQFLETRIEKRDEDIELSDGGIAINERARAQKIAFQLLRSAKMFPSGRSPFANLIISPL